MTRDETRYPNADKYIPERFLDAEGMLTDDKVDFVFGFGRRVCPGEQQWIMLDHRSYAYASLPGRHAADSSTWISMATMLATFDFNPAKDTNGKDIEFEAKYMNGMAR